MHFYEPYFLIFLKKQNFSGMCFVLVISQVTPKKFEHQSKIQLVSYLIGSVRARPHQRDQTGECGYQSSL